MITIRNAVRIGRNIRPRPLQSISYTTTRAFLTTILPFHQSKQHGGRDKRYKSTTTNKGNSSKGDMTDEEYERFQSDVQRKHFESSDNFQKYQSEHPLVIQHHKDLEARTPYPPMPIHPKPLPTCLSVEDEDPNWHNPWGDLDYIHSHIEIVDEMAGFQHEATEYDDLNADVHEMKDVRKYSLDNEDELVTYFREMQEEAQSTSHAVPMLVRQELYDMHKSDPVEWTTKRLSREYGLKKKRVDGIIKLFDLRTDMDQAYVRHEIEDLIIGIEELEGIAIMTDVSKDMDDHYNRQRHERRFIKLSDEDTREQAKKTLVKNNEDDQKDAKSAPTRPIIAEVETKRGTTVRFSEIR
jgi:hypothetical protein